MFENGRKTFRIISTLAWLIVGLLLLVAILAGTTQCQMQSIAAENAERAAEYAMKSAAVHLHNLEESMGPPWPAHGPWDYESEFVKSTKYTVEGKTVLYEFEIYITAKVQECYADADYYRVLVEYKNGVFSLLSATEIDLTGNGEDAELT